MSKRKNHSVTAKCAGMVFLVAFWAVIGCRALGEVNDVEIRNSVNAILKNLEKLSKTFDQ